MPRIEWTVTPGEVVEDMIAAMLLMDNPRGTHIRPSQGDGGIDVLIPTESDGVWDVYQIKKFAVNLVDGQKRQIEKSVKRLRQTIDAGKVKVNTCWITLPLNPTPENRVWLSGLASKYNVDLQWYGLTHIEGLTAKHLDIADYYCHGGIERLNTAIVALNETLRSAMRIDTGRENPTLSPSEILPHMASLQAEVNRNDPFHRYEFLLTHSEPEIIDRPGLVASVASGDGENFVTINVLAKSAAASELHPSFIRMRPAPTEEEREGFERMIEFGTAATFTAEFEISLPGGLSAPLQAGRVHMRPTAEQEQLVKPIRVLAIPESGPHFEVAADTTSAIFGMSGQNFSIAGRDRANTFNIEILVKRAPLSSLLRIQVETTDGRRAADIAESWNLLENLRRGYTLVIAPLYGLQRFVTHELEDEANEEWVWTASLLRDLVAIQALTMEPIVVPPLESITLEKRREIRKISRVARGEQVEITWGHEPLTLTIDSPSFDATGQYAIAFTSDLILETAVQSLHLGMVQHRLNRAVVTNDQIDEQVRRVTFEPTGGDNKGILSLPFDGIQPNRAYSMRLDT